MSLLFSVYMQSVLLYMRSDSGATLCFLSRTTSDCKPLPILDASGTPQNRIRARACSHGWVCVGVCMCILCIACV